MPLALTGYQSLLLGVALFFIAFALTVALLIPRWKPQFPSRYLGWFIAVVIVLFACQLTAVLVLANLGEKEAEAAGSTQTASNETLPVTTTPSPPPSTSTTPGSTTPTSTTSSSTTPTSTTQSSTTESSTTPSSTTPAAQGNATAGKEIFLSQPCGGCHTLKDAGTSGTVGPNLDQLKPPYDAVVKQVTNGGGAMPPFKDTLTPQQIQDVSAYVSSVAGK